MNLLEEHIVEYMREKPDLDLSLGEIQRQFKDATYGEIVHAMVYRKAEIEGTKPPSRCTKMCAA